MQYDLFVSYSHSADGAFAPAFQRALESTLRPLWRARSIRVFRDETGFELTDDLWPTIVEAMRASDRFVLLASPEAARSPWVEREVAWWLEHRDSTPIIVVTGGEVRWDPDRQQIDRSATDALPPALVHGLEKEPLMGDARGMEGARLRPSDPGFQLVVAKTFAAVRGLPLEAVFDQQRRQLRRRVVTAVLTSAVFLALGVGFTLARSQARAQREISLGLQTVDAAERLLSDRTRPVDASAAKAAAGLAQLLEHGQHSLVGAQTLREAMALMAGRRQPVRLPEGAQLESLEAADSGFWLKLRGGVYCRLSATGSLDCTQAPRVSPAEAPAQIEDGTSLCRGQGAARICGKLPRAHGDWRIQGYDSGEVVYIEEPAVRLGAYSLASGRLHWVVPIRGPLRAVHSAGDQIVVTYFGRRPAIFDAELWDRNSGRVERVLSHQGIVDVVAVAPYRRWLATSGTQYPSDRSVSLWSLPGGRELRRLPSDAAMLAVDSQGRVLVQDGDGVLSMWTEAPEAPIVSVSPTGDIEDVVVDGRGVALFQSESRLCRLDREDQRCVSTSAWGDPDELGNTPQLWATLDSGHRCDWAANDVEPSCERQSAGTASDELPEHPAIDAIDDVEATARAAVGGAWAVGGSPGDYQSGDVLVFESERAEAPRRIALGMRVHALSFSPEGEHLAVATGNGRGEVSVWRWRDGIEVARIPFPAHARSVAMAESGRLWVATGGLSDADLELSMHIWDSHALIAAFCERTESPAPPCH